MHDHHIDVNKRKNSYFVQDEVLCYVVPSMTLSDDEIIDEKLVYSTLLKSGVLGKNDRTNKDGIKVSAIRFPKSENNIRFDLFTVGLNGFSVAESYKQFHNDYSDGLPILDQNQRTIGHIKDLAPNWFIGSAYHTGLGPHGPGGPPRPVKDKLLEGLRFRYDDPFDALNFPSQNEICDDVVVYILDTIPDPNRLETATKNWRTLGKYFQKILDKKAGVTTPNQYETERATYHYAADIKCDLSKAYSTEAETIAAELTYDPLHPDPYALGKNHYDSSDHGVFIAGIIHMIAPSVKIHVLQVIAKNGAGTFDSYALGYNKIVEIHKQYPAGTKALINCSFTLAIPIDGHDKDQMDRDRSPEANGQAQGQGQGRAGGQSTRLTAAQNLYDYANGHGGFRPQLDELMDAIASSIVQIGAKVFAASGNDSDRRNKGSMIARYPAHFGKVIGVGALKQDRSKVANYSNDPDQPECEGYMVFGGDYENDATKHGIGEYNDSGEGIIGIFTTNMPIPDTLDKTVFVDEPLPPDVPLPNLNGFAEWKGTSFATPVLVGTVAALCCTQHLSVDEALEAIRKDSEKDGQINKFEKVVQVHDSLADVNAAS